LLLELLDLCIVMRINSREHSNMTTWNEYLSSYQTPQTSPPLLSDEFMNRWGKRDWQPNGNDRKASGLLHTQIISRIVTRELNYLDGVEKTALNSVFLLFDKTRDLCDQNPCSVHFKQIAWDVLNCHLAPFTAKWHPVSERGGLEALDTTDEFRAELTELQRTLRIFEDLLVNIYEGNTPAIRFDEVNAPSQDAIPAELSEPLPWGIPQIRGGIDVTVAANINQAEKTAITARRMYYWPDESGRQRRESSHLAGLALSGGGIRSATFSLGVLVALARRGILPQFDYLSTVSGGGYIGSFLTTFLNSPASGIGLKKGDLPFRREQGEAEALRHIRHHSKYLVCGSWWTQIRMVFAQLYGMATNGLGLALVAASLAVTEIFLRKLSPSEGWWKPAMIGTTGLLILAAGLALVLLRFNNKSRTVADGIFAGVAILLSLLLGWEVLGYCHQWVNRLWSGSSTWPLVNGKVVLTVSGAIPVIASAFGSVLGRLFKRVTAILLIVAGIAAPFFFFGIYLLAYHLLESQLTSLLNQYPNLGKYHLLSGHDSVRLDWGAYIVFVLAWLAYYFLLNINFTSPHRHYRNKLADAYIIQPNDEKAGTTSDPGKDPKPPFKEDVRLLLSEIKEARAPYQLINCALNVPSTSNAAMQGRLTDFFLFSKAYCGSPLIGYRPTIKWEEKDRHLDLGTAMAISGAAAAPQMGLGTIKPLRFWLALLNIRLGYWVHHPGRNGCGAAPGLWYLLREMLGLMDEKSTWLNLSDGGHIENLGVYELLRRRCKFIVAIDGEQDERMTFTGLTTLQRLAAIDFGTQIHIDLDDLRLTEKGLSRSHFRFCRIEYPEGVFGYLLYVKLSLTGNEGEFIRRYRYEEPAFPHHSTADQFFSESQFEAYRSLGEHVGDKLFLEPIIGKLARSEEIDLQEWFGKLGKSLLRKLPS
jgi:hypothetical protein